MKKLVLVLLAGFLMTPSVMFADKYNCKDPRQRHRFLTGYGNNFFLPAAPGNNQLNYRLRIHFF